MKFPRATIVRALAIGWLGTIGFLTLTSAPDQAARVAETPWSCLACGDAGLTDVVLNLLLFLPLGLLARAAGWSRGKTVLLLLLLTISIELTQGNFLAGRDASISDVLANTSGGLLGWLILPATVQSLRPTPAFARRAALGVLALSGLVWFLTSRGLQVALSPSAPWVGQLLHLWPGHDRFAGSLQQALLEGVPVPNDPLTAMPTRFDSLDLLVDVTRADTTVARRPVSMLRIVDANQQLQLSISTRRRDLLLEHRVVASRWSLRTPTWAFEGAAVIPANTPWRWHWLRRADRIILQSGPVSGPVRELMVPVSIGLGWAFIHPFAPAVGASATWWTVVWIGLWMALLGWFAGWVSGRAAIGFGAAAVISMGVASIIATLPLRATELGAAVVVYGCFALLSSRARYLRRRVASKSRCRSRAAAAPPSP